ncbi:hypothetical protein BD410DRAFT_247688 [Rickenella mellea]|uniref:Uncharacterized protein n=1 Tax=Rickenella mellea TaxID=50990 RepID=A0A4Y7QMF7_9AGAM|nr:hypothetical protein BD410DRAFT_247688 [Rickenella mellea]
MSFLFIIYKVARRGNGASPTRRGHQLTCSANSRVVLIDPSLHFALLGDKWKLNILKR